MSRWAGLYLIQSNSNDYAGFCTLQFPSIPDLKMVNDFFFSDKTGLKGIVLDAPSHMQPPPGEDIRPLHAIYLVYFDTIGN